MEQKFTPQNIYTKTEIKLSNLQEIEIKESNESDQEEIEITKSEEIVTFRSKLSPKEIEDYVNSLKATAYHWYNTFNPINNTDLTTQESLWIDRLNRIGIIYFRPLITVSFLNKNIDSKERVQLFKAIERFIFIAFRMSRSMANYRNSEFIKNQDN